MQEPTRSRTAAILPIAAILFTAVGLRCLFLAKQSLWLDEFASWWFASGDLSRALHSEATNPPLYYALLHFWIQWFGTSEAALRSLNILPSVASVWVIYRLSERLFSCRIALMAAGYAAVSTFQIYYAQEARCFSFLELFLLLAAWTLWNALESEGFARALYYGAYGLCMTLALYSHFIAVFFFAGQGLFVLVRRMKQVPFYAAGAAVAVLAFSPWLLTLLDTAGGGGQSYRHHLVLKLPQAYFSFIFGDSLIPLDNVATTHISETLYSYLPVLAASTAVVIVLLPFCWLAWKRWGDRMLCIVTLATVPVLLAWVVSIKVVLFDERYLMPASAFLFIAFAAAIQEMFDWRREHGQSWQTSAAFGALALGAILLAVSLYQYYFVERFGKDQWREAVAYLESAGGPKDVLLFEPDFLHYGYDYYQKGNLPYWKLTSPVASGIVRHPDSLKDYVSGFNRVWLIRSHDDNDGVLETVKSLFPEESHRFYARANGISLYSFRVEH